MVSAAVELRSVNLAPRIPQSEQTDEELFRAYREEGDRSAFAVIVHRYERELYNHLRRMLGNATVAEDCFQTVFLQVHQRRDQFEQGRRLRPWLYAISTNLAIDLRRQAGRQQTWSLDRNNYPDASDDENGTLLELLASSDAAPHDRAVASERREWVLQAVRDLPEILQSTVTLIYFQGMTYRSAAEILGIPAGTVKSRMHTALMRLTKAWEQSHPPGED